LRVSAFISAMGKALETEFGVKAMGGSSNCSSSKIVGRVQGVAEGESEIFSSRLVNERLVQESTEVGRKEGEHA
jgi:hypothetical protein